MSKQLKMFLMVAVAGSVICSASLTQAGEPRSTTETRSTTEPRQSPGQHSWDTFQQPVVRYHQHSFPQHSYHQHSYHQRFYRQPTYRQPSFHQPTFHQGWQPFSFPHPQQSYRPAPEKSKASWGWQRSIQDRRLRPGGR